MKQSELWRHLVSLFSLGAVNTCRHAARHDATVMLLLMLEEPRANPDSSASSRARVVRLISRWCPTGSDIFGTFRFMGFRNTH